MFEILGQGGETAASPQSTHRTYLVQRSDHDLTNAAYRGSGWCSSGWAIIMRLWCRLPPGWSGGLPPRRGEACEVSHRRGNQANRSSQDTLQARLLILPAGPDQMEDLRQHGLRGDDGPAPVFQDAYTRLTATDAPVSNRRSPGMAQALDSLLPMPLAGVWKATFHTPEWVVQQLRRSTEGEVRPAQGSQ